jgi:hypothetical protein
MKKSNCQVPNSFFGVTVNFIIKKLKFCKIEKEDTLILSCQLEIDHVTQHPKETCQRTCRGPLYVIFSRNFTTSDARCRAGELEFIFDYTRITFISVFYIQKTLNILDKSTKVHFCLVLNLKIELLFFEKWEMNKVHKKDILCK